jgi:hypothetical protein
MRVPYVSVTNLTCDGSRRIVLVHESAVMCYLVML